MGGRELFPFPNCMFLGWAQQEEQNLELIFNKPYSTLIVHTWKYHTFLTLIVHVIFLQTWHLAHFFIDQIMTF